MRGLALGELASLRPMAFAWLVTAVLCHVVCHGHLFRSRELGLVRHFYVQNGESGSSSAQNAHKFSVQGNDFPFRNVSLPWSERVKDLVSRLSLEEIQLQMGRGGAGIHGGPAPAIPRLGIGPYQWDTECLRGDANAPGKGATAFPQSIGLAAAFSPDLLFRVAQAAGVETRGKHNEFVRSQTYITHTGASCFSPVINIMRDSRWGRNQETYGEDPYLSGVYATNYVHGLQGNDSRYVRASAGCKHFDAYAGPENIPSSRMSFDAKVSERDLRMTFLPAFRKCVEAGTYSLMCSYNSINGVPACANKRMLTDILRTEWGFSGYVVSDESAIENIINDHHYLNSTVDTVAACVDAGCNLELSPNLVTPVYFSLVEAVKEGKVSEDTVRQRVSPLFYTRMRLGEFDPATLNPYSELSNADVESPAHEALAVEAAMKSFVLLKNDASLLPFRGGLKTIGVVGPFANTSTEMMGTYNPEPSPGRIVTALTGLQGVAKVVQYATGCQLTRCISIDTASVQRAVTGTDVNFVLVGTGSSIESEGNDRRDLELPGLQKQLVLDVLQYAPKTPVVLVVFSAGPVNISFADADARVTAILQCFFSAQATGTALRHVLLNDVASSSPAGRLPYTWPLYLSQLPPMVNYSMAGRTYRYFTEEPLYPFGYGLSYTTFGYSDLAVPSTVVAGNHLEGQVTVRNLGQVDSDEVVQVYISWMDQSLPAPVRQLVWFNRLMVPAGKSVMVRFTVEARSMALWVTHSWQITAGKMMVYVGGEQPGHHKHVPSNVLSQPFSITGTKVLAPA
ncbi:uncharacterized protein LOC143282917 [Babylonia areolata]|uniref:uncharacterized protein LOC143282917 n=1 Tax=Babylonia areolata TaxID=304850 RepID=UPI003FD45E1E